MNPDTITVVRGNPTDEELAALLTVLLTRRPPAPTPPSVALSPRWVQDVFHPPTSWAA